MAQILSGNKWNCVACTYANDPSRLHCTICNTSRNSNTNTNINNNNINNNIDQKDDNKQPHSNNSPTNKHIPLQDRVYSFNDKKIKQLDVLRPWKNEAMYFKNIRINILAATKMIRHAINGVNKGVKKGGVPIEIMGLLLGRVDINNSSTLIIMDCIELPVEGTETRVVADDEKVLGFMTRMVDRIELKRRDRFIGWYHSHPFNVQKYTTCFLSATDVNTQLMWQMSFGKWCGIVIDPLRSLYKNKMELQCFMCYPPSYSAPINIGPDGNKIQNKKQVVKRWGCAWSRYYKLKHSFFMGSLIKYNLEMMMKNHLWIKRLSSTSILQEENQIELPKTVNNIAKNTILNKKISNSNNNNGTVQQAITMSKDVVTEQCIAQSIQLIKNMTFNSTLN